jgi:hypothetical protein
LIEVLSESPASLPLEAGGDQRVDDCAAIRRSVSGESFVFTAFRLSPDVTGL